jgi:hypothetical protein
MSSESSQETPPQRLCAVVLGDDAHAMFELSSMNGQSANLTGPLLLEIGEMLTLRFDEGKLELKAEVVAVSTKEQRMSVHFAEITDQERKRLESL